MSKFTPGPWLAEEYFVITEKDYKPQKTIACSPSPHMWTMADAILISKAPEMYQLIADLRNCLITIYNPDSAFAEMADKYLDQAHKLLKEIDGD